jgi:hypothetical protein
MSQNISKQQTREYLKPADSQSTGGGRLRDEDASETGLLFVDPRILLGLSVGLEYGLGGWNCAMLSNLLVKYCSISLIG